MALVLLLEWVISLALLNLFLLCEFSDYISASTLNRILDAESNNEVRGLGVANFVLMGYQILCLDMTAMDKGLWGYEALIGMCGEWKLCKFDVISLLGLMLY